MRLDGLRSVVATASSYRRVIKDLRSAAKDGLARTITWELMESARPAVLSALRQEWSGPILVLSPQPDRARQLQEQTSTWLAEPSSSWYFPAPDSLFYDRTPWDGETIRQRISVLSSLASGEALSRPPLIFASLWAMMTLTAPPRLLVPGIQTLETNQALRPRSLIEVLVGNAYVPVSVVEEPGTFAQRGGIVDIYPPNVPEPVRIEWVGDQIETMRAFDPVTQRSLHTLEKATLFPASEALSGHSQAACALLTSLFGRDAGNGTLRIERDQLRMSAGEYFRGLEAYLPCLYPQAATILDYLPQHTLIVVDDPAAVDLAADALTTQSEALKVELVGERQLPETFPLPYRHWDQLQAEIAQRVGLELGYHLSDATDAAQVESDKVFRHAPVYGGQLEQVVADSLRRRADGQWTVIISRQAQRLGDLFAEAGYPVAPTDGLAVLPPSGSVTIVAGSLNEGWALEEFSARQGTPLALTLLTDAEVFGVARQRQRSFSRKKATSPESFFVEIHEGDYAVHIDHGIGIYRGLVTRDIDGEKREYLEVEYAEGDRLYVPVSQIDRLTRYVGGGDREPTVHRLGSADWIQVRTRATKAVENLARELLELYAARQAAAGHAFAPDTHWQMELEGSFRYQETEDQMRALAQVKEDMERPRPMDRLICGDVGYGKTEVAVRAAFKAVMDGKQVAVLVPTTVLAQQHTLTFKERFAAFPVQVAMLSRFCSPRELRETIDKLQSGQVDVVIGTHRLLQKDVSFKDLGLLIVDEEQRFGVRHKEWLKKARQQLDVMTMTATPIPRTLYMSLGGVRDMSVIDTPPEARLPIRTQAAEHDDGIIRRAILRELNRHGQVYFVHNRVQGIRQIAQHLQKVVPEATVTIGHGQMPESKLSQVMLEFAQGQQDLLVCTSIIESGLDIPNVNTIVINRADCFGLAQLYQLRGRVGRSTEQAYAYLLYDQHKKLTDLARRRLETILEAGELGAGFRIATRDLEIRGAGDILGSAQHGHIAAIGLELYTRLLSQAVAERKEAGPETQISTPEVRLPPLIELPLQAKLPDDYVADEELRIKLYQRMAALAHEQALDDIAQELQDRFGLLPEPATNLLYVLRVRLLATGAGVSAIGWEDSTLVLRMDEQSASRARQIVTRFGKRAWVGRGQLWLSLQGQEQDQWQELLVALLLALQPTQLGEPR